MASVSQRTRVGVVGKTPAFGLPLPAREKDVTELERSAGTAEVREIVTDWWQQHLHGGV